MKAPTLFKIENLETLKPVKPKVKYTQSKMAKQRYKLTQRIKQAGVRVDAKNRTIKVETMKHADPLTRKRIHKLMNHGFGGELKLNFPE